MNDYLNRREFLKLSSLLAFAFHTPGLLLKPKQEPGNPVAKNILIVVFDAFSAKNISLYGYSRQTTPNLSRIAEQAIIYHNHYAGGHWTVPGTASILTGTYPWTHRVFTQTHNLNPPFNENNIFGLFEDYYRIAYSHNPFAELLLRQLSISIDKHQPRETLFLNNFWLNSLFEKDYDIASVARARILNEANNPYANSLFVSHLYDMYQRKTIDLHKGLFPNGPPGFGGNNFFLLEHAIDWIEKQTAILPQPYLAYYHLFPPHADYRPRQEFIDAFLADGYSPVNKPRHFFQNESSSEILSQLRKDYDEYILYVDAEFGRLFETLDKSGALENTLVILTSDHGEMFERGIRDHLTHVFYEPVVRVPLLIWQPNRRQRVDIFSPTSAVDLLPTLLKIAEKPVPQSLEGEVLPPFANIESHHERIIYSVDARNNPQFNPIARSTAMMLVNQHKLVYYKGYEHTPGGEPFFELYDLQNDPEELENLYSENFRYAVELKKELLEKMNQQDEPYSN